MKDVCERTGLTRKTVLFYEDQGLLSPTITRTNGRDYRTYSEQDVKRLCDIAALRKCRFSIDSIKGMYHSPETANAVLLEHRASLLEEQSDLAEVLRTLDMLKEKEPENLDALVQAIEAHDAALELPQADLQPHFLHLDALEAEQSKNVVLGKHHRDARPLNIDQDHIFMDKRFGTKKLLDDLKNDLDSVPVYGVPDKPGGPRILGVIKGFAIIALIMACFTYIPSTRNGAFSKPALTVLGMIAGLILLIVGISFLQKKLRKE